ncbi:MAG TPA: type II toxin-antitoxin system VapC family toxin [Vicinamibacterales bacterium]|nr:type II toxin-antitoxin system VapC family toxin [Vicinamibacterales bacterium]
MILVDTGPLVALCDPRDARHTAAAADLARLAPIGLRTCEAVAVEACFHLPRPAQRQRLRAMLEAFAIEFLPTQDAEFRADVFTWLDKYGDHEPDWADACLATLSARHTTLKVWTYDREFRTIWRRSDGRAVPLAVR